MASTTTTSSTIDPHGSVEANDGVTYSETAQADSNSVLGSNNPARGADLRSSGPEERVNVNNELDAAPQSSHNITNSQAIVEMAASGTQTTLVAHESTHDEQEARHSAYPEPPNNDNHDDLDPAALLESLASYDHTQAHNSSTAYGDQESNGYQASQHHHANQFENDHFASLLQAAATAGQNQENDNHNHYESHPRDSQPLQEWNSHGINSQQHSQSSNTMKRKHSRASHDATLTPNIDSPSQWNSRTRRGLTSEADDSALTREHAIWGPSDHESESEAPSQSYTPLSPSSARAAGVHSAAALFRKPTPASKKYTRPPMSKLFTSLEIGPEQFLHLQAAAKTYMLDPAHPDRYNCVGSKAKVDTDMVKLKLFGCVENFLEDEGWGEKCWGVNAEREALPGHNNWRLRWPETRNKIITSVTPLMRRMVTNERQRRYANETRSKEKGGKAVKPLAATENGMHEQENGQLPPEIDPKLADYHYSLTAPDHDSTPATPAVQASSPSTTSFRVVIICPANAQQIIQSATLVLSDHASYDGILDYIRSWLQKSELAKQSSGGMLKIEALRVHLPAGLSEINGEQDWDNTLKIVQGTLWMQGLATVVVEVGTVDGATGNGSEQALGTEEHS